jgi:flagellin
MTVINTNTAATITANALTKNERAMSQAMERLSTGQRINSAGDDAAGLAISSRMTSQINGLNMAVRNAGDGISMAQTADGAMVEVTNMLQRMRELALQSSSGTMGTTDRSALDTEYQALSSQIQQVGSNTQWNGSNILDDTVGTNGVVSLQVGANASQTVDIDMGDVGASDITVSGSGTVSTGTDPLATLTFSADLAVGDVISFKIDDTNYAQITLTSAEATAINNNTASTPALDTVNDSDSNVIIQASSADTSGGNQISLATATADAARTLRIVGENAGSYTFALSDVKVSRGIHGALMASDIKTTTQATAAIKRLDTAITSVNTARAAIGAGINRLEYAADNLANVSQNTSASRSRILDADYASETTELARTQIIQQAGTAMLSQANQAAQSVLALLK